MFHIQNLQGGNRVGTVKNTGIQKFSSGYVRYILTPALDKFDGTEFKTNWGGYTVDAAMWDLGQPGNAKIFTAADGSKMPAGEYILQISNEWNANTSDSRYTDLKKQTIRLASPVKVGIDAMTEDQAMRVLSKGKARLSNKGKACPGYNSR